MNKNLSRKESDETRLYIYTLVSSNISGKVMFDYDPQGIWGAAGAKLELEGGRRQDHSGSLGKNVRSYPEWDGKLWENFS